MTTFSVQLIVAFALLSSSAIAAPPDRSTCPSISSANYYFAEKSFGEKDRFVRGWYSKHLRAMREPSLSCGTTAHVYRFTWLRTFHHPVAVRITANDSGASLVAVELNGAGGYEPGTELRRKETSIAPSELKKVQRALVDAGFSSLTATEDNSGFDGSEWIIEVLDNDQYHVISRWSPQTGVVHEIGLRFLKLAGWQFKPNETY